MRVIKKNKLYPLIRHLYQNGKAESMHMVGGRHVFYTQREKPHSSIHFVYISSFASGVFTVSARQL